MYRKPASIPTSYPVTTHPIELLEVAHRTRRASDPYAEPAVDGETLEGRYRGPSAEPASEPRFEDESSKGLDH